MTNLSLAYLTKEGLLQQHTPKEKDYPFPSMFDLGRLAKALIELADDDNGDRPSPQGKTHPAYIRNKTDRHELRDLTDKILRGLVSDTLEYLDLLTQIQGEGQGAYRRHDNVGDKPQARG